MTGELKAFARNSCLRDTSNQRITIKRQPTGSRDEWYHGSWGLKFILKRGEMWRKIVQSNNFVQTNSIEYFAFQSNFDQMSSTFRYATRTFQVNEVRYLSVVLLNIDLSVVLQRPFERSQ